MRQKNDTSVSAKLNTPPSKIDLSTYLQACIKNNLEIMEMVLSQKNSFTSGYWAVTIYYSKNTVEKNLAPWDWEEAFLELSPHKIVIQDPEFTKYLIANLDVNCLFDFLGNYPYIDRKTLFIQLWETGILNLSTPNLAALIKNPTINFADVIYEQCEEESLMDMQLCNFLLAHISPEDFFKIVSIFRIPDEDEKTDSDGVPDAEDAFNRARESRIKKLIFQHPERGGLRLFKFMSCYPKLYCLNTSFIDLYCNNILVLDDTAKNIIESGIMLDCHLIVLELIKKKAFNIPVEFQNLLLQHSSSFFINTYFNVLYNHSDNEYSLEELEPLIPYLYDLIGYIINYYKYPLNTAQMNTVLLKIEPLIPHVANTLKRSLDAQNEPGVEPKDVARYREYLQEISQDLTDDQTKKRAQLMTCGLPGLHDAKNKFLFFSVASGSTLPPELWTMGVGKAMVDLEVYSALKK